jgi:FtsP/CotA-like multicopper oxidase with cupredoxin domain
MARTSRLGLAAGFSAVLVLAGARVPAQTQTPTPMPPLPPCLQTGKPLLNPPVIKSFGGKLRATLKNVDGKRTIWGFDGDDRCASQNVRYFTGFGPGYAPPWPSGPDPLPGPTFRAQLGDLVEISFFNQVDPLNFAASLDRGTIGTMEACDQYTTRGKTASPQGDTMPDCLHGSSTTNVHFHGTHTTPSTTGDNVLLFIRPSLRVNGQVLPTEAKTNSIFSTFFSNCETHKPTAKAPWPNRWSDLPPAWVQYQRQLVAQFDNMPMPNGSPMPAGMQLGNVDQHEIAEGLWPQYQLGANPYCFPIPKDDGTTRMGQAPGTHWYHAHKHGSTALNVANGMTGVFIIEGAYDKQLHAYYSHGLREQVLMIQQLSTAPFPLTQQPGTAAALPGIGSPTAAGPPGAQRPRISVNGRLVPVVAMQPGEVQMWRIVNGAFRDAIQFAYFKPVTAGPQCDSVTTIVGGPTVHWRQIAQDGVQLAVANYRRFGAVDTKFNLAPANRADLLVQAPKQPGSYTLCVVRNNGVLLDTAAAPGAFPRPPSPLLTVAVSGTPVSPAVKFIPDANFPVQPTFLSDITSKEIVKHHRVLDFGAGDSTIDGQPFIDGHINQQMLLNTAEEWVVKNEANDKSHPFHIHINPFQILELFEPNAAQQPCPVNPDDPTTFDPAVTGYKPCPQRTLPAPWVWWDTFPIPTGKQIDITTKCAGQISPQIKNCPVNLQKYTQCSGGTCTETVAGFFRMRSRFVDFTGQYVLHCHILIHEDRGMMQLIEVTATTPTSDRSLYTHH